MTLFLYLLHQPCFRPCLRSLPLVYFIDLVPFLLPPCSISECLLVTVYTPSCFISYKYPSTSPCIVSLKSTKSLLPILDPCFLKFDQNLHKGSTLNLCRCTQSVSRTPGVIPGLGQPLFFYPHPLDPEFVQTLTQRRPGLDTIPNHDILLLLTASSLAILPLVQFTRSFHAISILVGTLSSIYYYFSFTMNITVLLTQ